jgi:hypothetical protein
MRHCLFASACVHFVTVSAVFAHETSNPAFRHLRPQGSNLEQLLREGSERSATFRRLVEALERSSVIVYIELGTGLPSTVGGKLRIFGNSPSHRFLRITLNPQSARPVLVTLLGHELQHALEIARSSEIQDESSFRAFYARFGLSTRSPDSFDSLEAREVEQRVRAELSLTSRDGPVGPVGMPYR